MKTQTSLSAPLFTRQTIGWFAVFGSAFFFFLATLIIRWSADYVSIPSTYYVFARLLLGFTLVAVTMFVQGQRPKPMNYHLIIGRTLGNTVARLESGDSRFRPGSCPP